MGCHGNGKISWSPNEFFFFFFFFLRTACFPHLLVKMNNLSTVINCPGGASRRTLGIFVPFFVGQHTLHIRNGWGNSEWQIAGK